MVSSHSPFLKALFLTLALVFLAHCTHQEVNPEDPDSLYKEAEESFKDEKYLIAIEKYRDIKNRFPYSARATDAELRIADAYFKQESYLEAASAYEIFRELHPTHPKSDYVQFQIAMSYFNQIPQNSARDLTAAHRTIDEFNVLFEKFPRSGYVAEGKQRVEEARRRLAEHEHYVAEFYYERKHYLSAAYRYTALLQEFPNLGYDEEALYKLAKSYEVMQMYANAKDAARRLVEKFPSSSYGSEAKSMLKELK